MSWRFGRFGFSVSSFVQKIFFWNHIRKFVKCPNNFVFQDFTIRTISLSSIYYGQHLFVLIAIHFVFVWKSSSKPHFRCEYSVSFSFSLFFTSVRTSFRTFFSQTPPTEFRFFQKIYLATTTHFFSVICPLK